MKAFKRHQAVNSADKGKHRLWQKCLFLLLVLPLWMSATNLEAAQITFSPNGLTVNIAPGEAVSVPFSATLSDTATSNSYANFGLAHIKGTLDRSWVKSRVYFSLNSWYKTRQAILHISTPADAKRGVYTGVFGTVWLRSNETIDPAEFMINVEIGELLSCNQLPIFSDITSPEKAINARNNKKVAIDLAGAVSVPEGCEIEKAWYQLTDEYGELDQEQTIALNSDGSFSVAIPMVASRKGNDKDGRLYIVRFMAENEAGVSESGETSITVTHDNRKK